MLITHRTTSTFDPSAREDGNDVILTLCADLTVDLTRAQTERLHAVLSSVLAADR